MTEGTPASADPEKVASDTKGACLYHPDLGYVGDGPPETEEEAKAFALRAGDALSCSHERECAHIYCVRACVCMRVCLFVYEFIYARMHVHACMCTHEHVSARMHAHRLKRCNIYQCISMYINVYQCISIYINIYQYVCVYMSIYMRR